MSQASELPRGSSSAGALEHVFPGTSELAGLMRAFDWSRTPLGPATDWPQALKTCVRILLSSRQPMWLGWGEQLTYLYNDPYKSIIGGKHPWALGRPTREVWHEIWAEIGPRIETTMQGEEGTYDEALLLLMQRHGYPEETYYTFSYSPIPDDLGGVGGLFCANTEDTQRIVGERQLALLRELAARTVDARTVADACLRSGRALETNPRDLPFALIYLVEPDPAGGQRAVLAGTAGISRGHPAAPERVRLDGDLAVGRWPLAEVLHTGEVRLIECLDGFGVALPAGAWDRPPTRGVALPIAPSGERGRAGVLVAGLNPYRVFDEGYRGFLELVDGQIAAAIGSAQAYEEERQRWEALAELDRAKTTFFSNVSHEFRTPLTLLLGPVEDLLAGARGPLAPAQRHELEVAQRNSLRLLRLVNALLDFSRIEAGRVQASYTPTDLPAVTAELASTFRSAIERAGLRLVTECPALPAGVTAYVDREMWEKIVLNLLSNSFKHTFEGQIEVALRATPDGHAIQLSVRDTGTGIPADEVPRLFERFHRVEGARARTHEGTGIGLALVQELVKLHGGTIDVQSTLGQGSTFTVTLPAGGAHLPADRIDAHRRLASTATSAAAFVEEALRWLPEGASAAEGEVSHGLTELGDRGGGPPGRPAATLARVLLADDNADLRDYLARLLAARYEVEAVPDGAAALAAARTRPPDLVLADVMMPELDGFGLVRALRTDPRTREIPVILLSARAGEEATVEGIEVGADDYLVKPFSTRELLARVATHLELARVRAEAAERERTARAQAEALAEDNARLLAAAQEQLEAHVRLNAALRETAEARDQARAEAVAARQHLYDLFMQTPACIAVLRGPERVYELVNGPYLATIGRREAAEVLGKPIREVLPELQAQGYLALQERVYATGEPFVGHDMRVLVDRRGDGTLDEVFYTFAYQPTRGPDGQIDGILVHSVDVTEHVRAREALREREERLRSLMQTAHEGIWLVDLEGHTLFANARMAELLGTTPEAVAGRAVPEFCFPEDVALARERIGNNLRGQSEQFDFRFRRADGSAVHVLAGTSPVRDAAGEVVGAMGMFSDITERRQAEEERQRLEQNKDQFLAAASHDLKNPLTSIKAQVQLLQRRANTGTLDADRLSAGLASIDAVVSRVVAQIDALLDITRLRLDRPLELEYRPTDLVALVRRSVAEQQATTEQHELILESAVEELVGSWDERHLERVLSNLLSNAIKFSPRGGRITVGLARQDDAAGDWAIMSVSDQGLGIPAADLQRIFEPLHRAANVASTIPGSGIGLASVRQIVAQHGGRLEVTSQEGEGSTFTLHLPLTIAHDGPGSATQPVAGQA